MKWTNCAWFNLGVRLSGFPNEEDKKHQQRSIVGFLQAGNQTLSATGCTEKTDKDQFLKPVEMSHKKSFFDKKRSERKWSHQDTFKYETVNGQGVQTSQSFQVLKKKMSENLETSESSNNHQMFTCPVCFREQGSISLDAFNKHVDACLSGPSTSEMFSCSHASSTEVNKKENVHHSFSLCEKQDSETHQKKTEITSEDCVQLVEAVGNASKAESVDASSNKLSEEGYSSLPSTSFNIEHCHQNSSCTVSLQNEDSTSSRRQETLQPCSYEVITDQALICPVCNLEQKTSDLTLFNVHVDICLNKGIIQELEKDKVSPVNQPKGSTRSTGKFAVILKNFYFPGVFYLNCGHC